MRASRLALALPIVIGATWLVAHPAAQRPRFDVVIDNGRIVDGTGARGFAAMLVLPAIVFRRSAR
jgi:hypothetical protein